MRDAVVLYKDMVIGYVTGVFDFLHEGHIKFLKRCSKLCDRLIVGLTTDFLCTKEKRIPFQNYFQRKLVLEHLSFVDIVLPHTGRTKYEDYQHLQFDILFTSEEYRNSDEFTLFESQTTCPVIYLPRTHSVSTTKLSTDVLTSMLTNTFTILNKGIHGQPTYQIGDSVVKLIPCGHKDSDSLTDGYSICSTQFPLLYPRNWKGLNLNTTFKPPNISGVNPFREMYCLLHLQKHNFVPNTHIVQVKSAIGSQTPAITNNKRPDIEALLSDRNKNKCIYASIQPFAGHTVKHVLEDPTFTDNVELIEAIKSSVRHICDVLMSEGAVHGDIHNENICVALKPLQVSLIDWGWSLLKRFPKTATEQCFYTLALKHDFDYSHWVLSATSVSFTDDEILQAQTNINNICNGITSFKMSVQDENIATCT